MSLLPVAAPVVWVASDPAELAAVLGLAAAAVASVAAGAALFGEAMSP